MVGEKIAEFLATLYKREVVKDLSQVHLIGSSLGAHVAGISGHVLKTDFGLESKIGRITGMNEYEHFPWEMNAHGVLFTALDPAGLFYRGRKAVDEKLDKEDAEFVDVIHTNMGQLGLNEVMGHVDMFPNGSV